MKKEVLVLNCEQCGEEFLYEWSGRGKKLLFCEKCRAERVRQSHNESSKKYEARKSKNKCYESVCEAHALTGGEQEPQAYDYIQLLGLASKYDMDEKDTKLIVEAVYDYLDKNWRW